jgi:hypothetical protein
MKKTAYILSLLELWASLIQRVLKGVCRIPVRINFPYRFHLGLKEGILQKYYGLLSYIHYSRKGVRRAEPEKVSNGVTSRAMGSFSIIE